jgi:cytochrome c peroxidase
MSRSPVCILAAVLAGVSCSGGNLQKAPPAALADRAIKVEIPIGLPPISYPAGGAPTEAKIELGRRLFYDKNLSLDGSVACSSCHNPRFGFADIRPVSEGVGGRKGTRNSPSLINVAYGTLFFWDGRAQSLEAPASEQLSNITDMAHSPEALEAKLKDNSIYRAMFERAYGPGTITKAKLTNALAVFQRLILSGNSLFDKYTYLGNPRALSQSAVHGLELFTRRANCATCHQIGKQYALFTDGKFHNLGVGSDPGRYSVTKAEADRGAFKTPTLRNITQTRPYMHDGSLSSLTEVVEFYSAGGRRNPNLSKLIRPLDLSAQDKIDLIAFLESLSGEPAPHIGPPEGEQ